MKYRVLKNVMNGGTIYKVQYRWNWFPFWSTYFDGTDFFFEESKAIQFMKQLKKEDIEDVVIETKVIKEI